MWKKLCSAIIAIVKLLFDILVEVFNPKFQTAG